MGDRLVAASPTLEVPILNSAIVPGVETGKGFLDCYTGPKLYFVPSTDLLDVGFFHGRQTLGELMAAVRQAREQPQEAVKQRLLTILNLLRSKGLVYEQPLR